MKNEKALLSIFRDNNLNPNTYNIHFVNLNRMKMITGKHE